MPTYQSIFQSAVWTKPLARRTLRVGRPRSVVFREFFCQYLFQLFLQRRLPRALSCFRAIFFSPFFPRL